MSQLRHLRPLGCFLVFTAIASWMAIFLHDPARPSTVSERADRLAAQNLLAGSFSAPTPPSPAHWAQREIWLDPDSGRRLPVARDASALLLALSGGKPRVAGVLSFALAGLALTWLLRRIPNTSIIGCGGLSAAILVTVAHGRAWQLSDPFPFALLASSSLALSGWMGFRENRSRRPALVLGAGLSGILLCQTALAVMMAGVFLVDAALIALRSGKQTARGNAVALGWVALLPALLLGVFAVRNTLTLGKPWPGLATRYAMEYTSAPRWFWQSIRPPPPDVDWVIEHHDELVALPASRWESPVIKAWGRRLGEGACHAGGLVFVLVALASAFFRPKALHRPALLVCGGTALVSLLAYAMAPAWWTLATPAIAWLLIQLREDIRARPDGSTLSTRLAWICIAAQAASLPGSAQDRPGAAEYDYAKYLGQIEKRLADEGGKHLIFTRFNLAADPCVEPADLPRDWDRLRFLYARELGVEKDKSLVAAMPDRTPWVITIFRDSIGLLPWKKPAVPEKAEATSEKVEPAPPPATAAPQ